MKIFPPAVYLAPLYSSGGQGSRWGCLMPPSPKGEREEGAGSNTADVRDILLVLISNKKGEGLIFSGLAADRVFLGDGQRMPDEAGGEFRAPRGAPSTPRCSPRFFYRLSPSVLHPFHRDFIFLIYLYIFLSRRPSGPPCTMAMGRGGAAGERRPPHRAWAKGGPLGPVRPLGAVAQQSRALKEAAGRGGGPRPRPLSGLCTGQPWPGSECAN